MTTSGERVENKNLNNITSKRNREREENTEKAEICSRHKVHIRSLNIVTQGNNAIQFETMYYKSSVWELEDKMQASWIWERKKNGRHLHAMHTFNIWSIQK